MKLIRKKVCRELGTAEKVEELIKDLFPPEEQEPIDRLLKMAEDPMVHFWAYYDEDVFCGMTYVVVSEDAVFGLYLATPRGMHSKGYGTYIIDDTKETFKGKGLVVHVEDPTQEVANKEQRCRRVALYERQGFKDTGYRINGGDTVFMLMSTADDFKIEHYIDLMHDYSKGEYDPPVYKAEK